MGVRWGFTGACISQNLTNSIKIGILHHIEVVLQKKNKRYTNIELLGRISSVGKESACNAGDLGLIPGLGRSPGEGIGYPLQYSWASLVAQLVKNLPAMWETWVRSLGWEDPLEKEMAIHSSILAWRIPWTEEPGGLQSMGLQRVGHDWTTKHTRIIYYMLGQSH